jgi:hypothetical protein
MSDGRNTHPIGSGVALGIIGAPLLFFGAPQIIGFIVWCFGG